MGRTLIAIALGATLLVLSGCSCCAQGGPRVPTDAACRGGGWPCWPLERNNLAEGEVQLTPALNKAFNCPGYSDGYCYTKMPFRCDPRYSK